MHLWILFNFGIVCWSFHEFRNAKNTLHAFGWFALGVIYIILLVNDMHRLLYV